MKKILSVVIAFVLSFSAVPLCELNVSAATSGYYTYTVSNGKATITKCDETISGNVTIPSTLGGYTVTSIGEDAFLGCASLASINIPEGVTSIGWGAFYNCTSLTSVTIGNGVTSIGSTAFSFCNNLTSITIPDGVESIGTHAFYGCTELASITIPDSVISIGASAFNSTSYYSNASNWENNILYIGKHLIRTSTSINDDCVIKNGTLTIAEQAFYHCTRLTSVTIPDSVESISCSAFSNCFDLTSITIPDSITSIGSSAFYDCRSLTSITIPDSVTSIGDNAFFGCTSLEKMTLPFVGNILNGANDTHFGYIFGARSHLTNGEYVPSSLKEVVITKANISSDAFRRCNGLTSVIIGDGVTSIGNNAFFNCESLKSITISDSVTNIGYDAFSFTAYYNNSLNWDNKVMYIDRHLIEVDASITGSYTIKSGTVSIANSAFAHCHNLTSITIPESVTGIGNPDFSETTVLYGYKTCSALVEYAAKVNNAIIYLDAKDEENVIGGKIGELNWSLDKRIGELVITGSGEIIDFEPETKPWYEYNACITEVKISDGVTSIGDNAFKDCVSLESVTIPDSVESIGNSTFFDCGSLTSITLPNSVKSIGNHAFGGCSGLASITIPNSVTSIGDYVFGNCESLTSVTIGNSVTSIGVYAFEGCASLASITIPEGVTSIGWGAFYNCTSLKNVTIPDSVTSVGGDTFFGCTSLTSISIPNSVTSIGWGAFYNCTSLTSITIPDRVISISDYAFEGCASLASITIPESVTGIGECAFYRCSRLEKIYIYSKNCVYNDYCGLNCGHIIYGYVGSTAQTLANEVGAEFIDITTIHVHNYNSATCTSPQICKVCGFTTGESLGHTGGTATCKTKAKCTRCEEYYGSLNANNHVNVKPLEAVASTCTKTGLTEGKKCADCDKVIVAQQTVAKKDHSYSNNCDKSCNVCGKTRTVGAHKYSNSCDTSCNVCRVTRTITHSYKTTTTKATISKNGSIVKKCTICGKVASNTAIKYAKSFKLSTTTYTHNGKVKTPSVVVKDSAGKTLKKNTDYTVSYASGRKNVGTYKVTIKMKGKYSGTKTLTFKINPAKTKVSKLTAGKKRITVAITKKSTQVTGYQIQYSTSKKFTNTKTKTITSYKTTKHTLKSLSAKKTYYVRVRTYKTVGKTKYYSGWSTYKYVKTK